MTVDQTMAGPAGPLASGQSPLAPLFTMPELVAQVIRHFERPAELAVLARVNHEFCAIARKALYNRVWVRPWEGSCDDKLLGLFDVLSRRPDLCRLVRTLDVRFFPLGTDLNRRLELDDKVDMAFSTMSNLEHLVWTRDKSLTPHLVETVSSLSNLRTLELSGRSRGFYDPAVLGTLSRLEEIKVYIPDSSFRDALIPLVKAFDQRPAGGLRGFEVITNSSPLVDDATIIGMAPYFRNLRRLALWGCTRVTRGGLFHLLVEAEHLEHLSLDASTHADLADLSGAPPLPDLETLSLSFSLLTLSPARQKLYLFVQDMPALPHLPSLTSLLLTLTRSSPSSTTTTALEPPLLSYPALASLTSQVDFSKLDRLALLGMYADTDALKVISNLCPNLREVYIGVTCPSVIHDTVGQLNYIKKFTDMPDKPQPIFSSLRILHVNTPLGSLVTTVDLELVAKATPSLEQVGTMNRVFQVHREYQGDTHVVHLRRWSKVEIPGYFRIWRG